MPFKGFNSILFDSDSIIDIEISMIRYFDNLIDRNVFDQFKDIVDEDKISRFQSTTELAFKRMYDPLDLIKYILRDRSMDYNKFMYNTWDSHKKSILRFAFNTDAADLISAYFAAGNGTISTKILVQDQDEESYIKRLIPIAETIMSSREDVDTSKFGRIIVGDFRNLFKYKFHEPKSILLLNYRDNFSDLDMKLLRAELVINFGDVHDISVMPAYKNLSMGISD